MSLAAISDSRTYRRSGRAKNNHDQARGPRQGKREKPAPLLCRTPRSEARLKISCFQFSLIVVVHTRAGLIRR